VVTLSEIIRAEKSDLSIKKWKTGKIPQSAFPIGRAARSIQVGPSWSWCICEFVALNLNFRVLIRVNLEKEKYHAYLALEDQSELKVVCRHDLHLPDKNWHCHFVSGNVTDARSGTMGDPKTMRVFEAYPSKVDSALFILSLSDALKIASTRYQFCVDDKIDADGQPQLELFQGSSS
jgi:hypothetical protein